MTSFWQNNIESKVNFSFCIAVLLVSLGGVPTIVEFYKLLILLDGLLHFFLEL